MAVTMENCNTNATMEHEEEPRCDILEGEQQKSTSDHEQVLVDMNWEQLDDLQAWDMEQEYSIATTNVETNSEEPDFFQQVVLPSAQNAANYIHQKDPTQDGLDILELPDVPGTTPQGVPLSTDLSRPSGITSEVALFTEACLEQEPAVLSMSNHANLSKIPAEARILLDYYSRRIIDVMSIAPAKKPPWETIHLPCAMSALAELIVYGETKSFAKMSLFYALLSVCSYHIGLANTHLTHMSQYWCERGAFHKHKAENFLRAALTKGLPKSSRGKYKEILMSFLSMVTIGVCTTPSLSLHRRIFGSKPPFINNITSPLRMLPAIDHRLSHKVTMLELANMSAGLQWKYARCSLLSN